MCLIVSLYFLLGLVRTLFLFERLRVILVPSIKLFSKVSFRMPLCSILSWTSSIPLVLDSVVLNEATFL